jgi:hypothetical protein
MVQRKCCQPGRLRWPAHVEIIAGFFIIKTVFMKERYFIIENLGYQAIFRRDFYD